MRRIRFGLQISLGAGLLSSGSHYHVREHSSEGPVAMFREEAPNEIWGVVSFELTGHGELVLTPGSLHLRFEAGLQLSNVPGWARIVELLGMSFEMSFEGDAPTTAPLARVLVGFDVAPGLALRLGPALAVQLYPSDILRISLAPMGTFELSLRLLDRLEAGVVLDAGASIPVDSQVDAAFLLQGRALLGYVF